jgi:hypothetical protein
VKLTRRRGAIRMRLDPVEVQLLASLLDDLAGLYVELDEGLSGPVRERLFPLANRDDAEIAREFRELTESALLQSRSDRLGQCRADLGVGKADVELDEESADRWLTVLNDLRLSIGTVIGIGASGSEGADEDGELDPADPLLEAKLTYHWLTAMQDSLVRAAMD